ncbi:MAG: phosphoribosylanthranilate isomerase [Pseudomonadota bacterium]
MPAYTPPEFITFTGLDTSSALADAEALSQIYPIEWGVLLDPAQVGASLFPNHTIVTAIRSSPLRLSAHICGAAARDIALNGDADIDLAGFSRAQINHGVKGSDEAQIENCAVFGARRGLRAALQCQGDFPQDTRVDWLFDVSFGAGIAPAQYPAISADNPIVGISGGLGPGNIAAVLRSLQVAPNARYWIDMESRIRTNGMLDLGKCRAVCEAVFGAGDQPRQRLAATGKIAT